LLMTGEPQAALVVFMIGLLFYGAGRSFKPKQ
jgi:hypothetical protein